MNSINNIYINPQIKSYLVKYNIHTIINVYKESYINKHATGFGDFIRGCYFLLDFCKIYNLKYNIFILHPISNFLKNKPNYIISNNLIKSIPFFEFTNFNENIQSDYNNNMAELNAKLMCYIQKLPIIHNTIFLYNTVFPVFQIDEEHKTKIFNLISPNYEMNMYIENTLQKLTLQKYIYKAIHIRYGDDYFINNKNNKNNNNKNNKNNRKLYKTDTICALINHIRSIINIKDQYIIISDNNFIKNIIHTHFSNTRCIFKEITHLGEGSVLNNVNIKDTLLDFYLLSYANYIYNFSNYQHGSSFSKWCAITYNIPYTSTQL